MAHALNVLSQQPDANTRAFLHEAAASDFDFHSLSTAFAGNEKLRTIVNANTLRQYSLRKSGLANLPDAEGLRTLAGRIKQHALDYLDFYLAQFTENMRRKGGHVHFAADAEAARKIIVGIARDARVKRVIKSKSMVSEEIHLAPELEEMGADVVETDLGEFIIQISHDRPSHLVAPIIHKDRASIGKLFSEYFRTPLTEDPQTLTFQARAHLRDKFRRADLGMTGANFLVAETGQVCVVENEGNARQSLSTPRLLITLAGIEKIVPRKADLAVLLKLLARSSTGQAMTVYTSIFGGPRGEGETDGPEEHHVVLLDNGRSKVLASEEYRQTLRCIRCGACLNACPVYRNIGGHAYGSVYPGPIGALITPLMQGEEKFSDLPRASSLCGACYEACPVKIEIPKLLVSLRRDQVTRNRGGRFEQMLYRSWAWMYASPLRYRIATAIQKWSLRRLADGDGFIRKAPPPGGGWTQARDLPAPAAKTFAQLWVQRGKIENPEAEEDHGDVH